MQQFTSSFWSEEDHVWVCIQGINNIILKQDIFKYKYYNKVYTIHTHNTKITNNILFICILVLTHMNIIFYSYVIMYIKNNITYE